MQKGLGKVAVGVLAAMMLGGCRFKGAEGFMAATTPMPDGQGHLGEAPWKGDPYTEGGIGDANGGLHPQTNYGKGSTITSGAVNPAFDQPAKGSGSQPGEYTNEAASGFGKSNGPGLQSSPSDVNNLSSRHGQ
ncbi:MAG: hypothetical protein ACAH95_14200 [Fimbriimonas sp.]